MEINMNREQRGFIKKYQTIYNRIEGLEEEMQKIQAEITTLLKELETLREEERKKFKTKE